MPAHLLTPHVLYFPLHTRINAYTYAHKRTLNDFNPSVVRAPEKNLHNASVALKNVQNNPSANTSHAKPRTWFAGNHSLPFDTGYKVTFVSGI